MLLRLESVKVFLALIPQLYYGYTAVFKKLKRFLVAVLAYPYGAGRKALPVKAVGLLGKYSNTAFKPYIGFFIFDLLRLNELAPSVIALSEI